MNNTIEYRFCLSRDTFIGKDIVTLINNSNVVSSFNFTKFETTLLGIYEPTVIGKKVFDKLNMIKEDIDISFYNDSEDTVLTITSTAHVDSKQCIILRTPSDKNAIDSALVREIIENEKFIIGYVFDYEFTKWQNETYPEHYTLFDKSLAGKKILWNSFFNENQVDISNNPSRLSVFKGLWITISPVIFLGEKVFDLFNIEKVKQSKIPLVIEYLKNNVIKVVLFNEILSSEKQENYQKLVEFRRITGIDDLTELSAVGN